MMQDRLTATNGMVRTGSIQEMDKEDMLVFRMKTARIEDPKQAINLVRGLIFLVRSSVSPDKKAGRLQSKIVSKRIPLGQSEIRRVAPPASKAKKMAEPPILGTAEV